MATVILKWVAKKGIETANIARGKPWQNGADESFNGKFRDECLNMEWFRNRIEAEVIRKAWRLHHNAVRRYSSLNHLTPGDFKKKIGPAYASTPEAVFNEAVVRRIHAGQPTENRSATSAYVSLPRL